MRRLIDHSLLILILLCGSLPGIQAFPAYDHKDLSPLEQVYAADATDDLDDTGEACLSNLQSVQTSNLAEFVDLYQISVGLYTAAFHKIRAPPLV